MKKIKISLGFILYITFATLFIFSGLAQIIYHNIILNLVCIVSFLFTAFFIAMNSYAMNVPSEKTKIRISPISKKEVDIWTILKILFATLFTIYLFAVAFISGSMVLNFIGYKNTGNAVVILLLFLLFGIIGRLIGKKYPYQVKKFYGF